MPSTRSVKNSIGVGALGQLGTKGAKRSRYEKSEIAYGRIPATAYAKGDTLVFDQIPMKDIINARLSRS